MSRNKDCKIKYCSECKVRMIQGNCREEVDHVILTRRCPKCGKLVHLVEVERERYNKTIEAMNKIIDFLAETQK